MIDLKGGRRTYVRPVLLLIPARKAEMRTASKAICVRRPSCGTSLAD